MQKLQKNFENYPPTVSVALTTYNGERFIEEQIHSLLSQDYPIKEIVVCDDCSSDNTVQILNRIEADIIKIVVNEENLGYVKNFEKVCRLCTGDLIALCDQDDIWLSDKLSEQVNVLIEGGIGVFSNAYLVDQVGEILDQSLWDIVLPPKGEVPKNLDYKSFYLSNCVTGCTFLFRKELLDIAVPFCQAVPHDWWLAYHAAYINGLKYTTKKLVKYRQHDGNVIGVVSASKARFNLMAFLRKKVDKYRVSNRLGAYKKWHDVNRNRLHNMLLFESDNDRKPSRELEILNEWFEDKIAGKNPGKHRYFFEADLDNSVFALTGPAKFKKSKYLDESYQEGVRRIKKRVAYKYVIGFIFALSTAGLLIQLVRFL